MTHRRGGLAALALAVTLGTVVGCGQPLDSAAGLVISVESPALGRVDSFELRTRDGDVLEFDTTELGFRPEFPAAHLGEHMRLAEAIRVTFRRDGDRRIVVRLADEG